MAAQKQGKSPGGRPGKNGNRPANQRYRATERWVINSNKRIVKHLKVHGPLNPRRKDGKKATWKEVDRHLASMGIDRVRREAIYDLVKGRLAG